MILDRQFRSDVLFNHNLSSTSKLLWYYLAYNGTVWEFDNKISIRGLVLFDVWSLNLNISTRQCRRCFDELLNCGLLFVKQVDLLKDKHYYIEINEKAQN